MMSIVSFFSVVGTFLACATGLQVDVNAASGGQMLAGTAYVGVQAHYHNGDEDTEDGEGEGDEELSSETQEGEGEGEGQVEQDEGNTQNPAEESSKETVDESSSAALKRAGLTDMETEPQETIVLAPDANVNSTVQKRGKLQEGVSSPMARVAKES